MYVADSEEIRAKAHHWKVTLTHKAVANAYFGRVELFSETGETLIEVTTRTFKAGPLEKDRHKAEAAADAKIRNFQSGHQFEAPIDPIENAKIWY